MKNVNKYNFPERKILKEYISEYKLGYCVQKSFPIILLEQSFTCDFILWGFIYFYFPQSMNIILIQCVYHYLFEKSRRQKLKKKKCFPNSPLRPFNYRIYFVTWGPTKHDKNEPVESSSLPHRIPQEGIITRRECCSWRISLQEKRGAFKMYPHIIPNQHFICKYNPEHISSRFNPFSTW